MQNLRRALRIALKYKWSLVGSIVSSILVAIFWGANLGAVYPFIEVVLHNKSLHDWADENVADAKLEIETRRDQLALIRENKADGNAQAIAGEIRTYERKLSTAEYFQPLIKKYAPNDPFDTLKYIVVFMLIGTFARCVFLAVNMYLVDRIGQRTILDLQNRVFNNVLDMEMSEVGVKGTGDLINRIRVETGAIGIAITTLFGKSIREPMKMTACLIGAACVNWRLLLFSLIVCPAAVAIMIVLARQAKRANRKAMEESAKLLNRLYQALEYLRMVKSYNMQGNEARRFKVVARDVYRKAMRISLLDALARSNNELLSVTVIGLSVLAGGYLVLNQQTHLFFIRMCNTPMDFGQVMLFFAFLIGSVDPLRKMGDVYNKIQSGVVASDRVFPIIDQVPAVKDPRSPLPIADGQTSVTFEDVGFSYEADKPVLKDVSFELPAGASMAIIGHNGCGKSTLINLVPRFFDADRGRVLLGGVDVRDVQLEELRKEIGFVTQMTMLFGDSVLTNISYGTPDATIEEVEIAARKAYAHEFISELEDGYDSQIGERGTTLSGGQQQRLSLARAILKNPKVLILDEATSQIDPESERLVHDALRDFMRERTTIIITHRMSTLELVDYILVMKDGAVVDFGRHDELMLRCPLYSRLRSFEFQEAA